MFYFSRRPGGPRDDGRGVRCRRWMSTSTTPTTSSHPFRTTSSTISRENDPVHFHEEPGGPGFWVIARFDDVLETSREWSTFSSTHGTNVEDAQGGAELMMLNMDPPQHTKFRKLVSKGFTPRMIARMEPHIREIAARDHRRRSPSEGECDFVTEDRRRAAAAGDRRDDRRAAGGPPQGLRLVERLIGFDDPEYADLDREGAEAAAEMFVYANTLADGPQGRHRARTWSRR